MGANAQTAVPAFTTGQVLTAAQMTDVNTGIPVFADSTARDAAFGGSGEKVLAEGQYAFLEDTNATQFYDGASWQVVGGGLVKIAGTTSFSAVSSFTLPAATFTSAYKNYLLLVSCVASGVGDNITLQVRSSGTTATTTYFSALDVLTFANTTANLFSNNASSFLLTTSATSTMSFNLNLGAGFGQTGFATVTGFFLSENRTGSSTFGGQHRTSQNNDSLVFSVASGTITGNYEVYGYAL
jgi:hypothetical protein